MSVLKNAFFAIFLAPAKKIAQIGGFWGHAKKFLQSDT